MNVKLLRKVKKHILEEPRRFVMRTFVVRRSDVRRPDFLGDNFSQVMFPQCNTAACIAGWAVLLSDGMDAPAEGLRQRAIDLLGLHKGDEMHDELFEVSGWPEDYSDAYMNAASQEARAKIAAERIEHFISTKGAE